jgi:DNA-binding MarR family transcriptional regulator
MAAPLSTLLSQALVAFTIEFDNEFEHRMPHRTATGPAAKSRAGPWLVSQAMWANLMQFVGEDGTPLNDLRVQARMTNLNGLRRWGYVAVSSDAIVRPTAKGRQAQEIWRPLGDEIEGRWRARFGAAEVERLGEALAALVGRLDQALPPYLPVVTDQLFTRPQRWPDSAATPAGLSAALAQALLAFTLAFEQASPVSLPIAANALRVLGGHSVRVRDLPRLTGVSTAAISWSLGKLATRGYAVAEPDPAAPRGKVIRLTEKGLDVRGACGRRIAVLEEGWRAGFGDGVVDQLRGPLERLVGDGGPQSPLTAGLQPYPDGWRATVQTPDTLPHHPMVLHRGGYPDGA